MTCGGSSGSAKQRIHWILGMQQFSIKCDVLGRARALARAKQIEYAVYRLL